MDRKHALNYENVWMLLAVDILKFRAVNRTFGHKLQSVYACLTLTSDLTNLRIYLLNCLFK